MQYTGSAHSVHGRFYICRWCQIDVDKKAFGLVAHKEYLPGADIAILISLPYLHMEHKFAGQPPSDPKGPQEVTSLNPYRLPVRNFVSAMEYT